MRIVVTGGAGFIGSAVVREALLTRNDLEVVNVDKLTYAGNLESLGLAADHKGYWFEKQDICDSRAMSQILKKYQPDAILHLAAESHVDRSIDGPSAFIDTNINGTFALLHAAREYYECLNDSKRPGFRFHHVSTDEVFGSLGAEGLFTESSPYQPNSPYSASKAASDHLVRAWGETYGLPVLTTNCSNNYGPYQFPEKLIPLMILNALEGKPLPVYGDGSNVRDWLYVEDHARALLLVLEKGEDAATYNIGGHNELTNLAVVRTICFLLDTISPRNDGNSYSEQVAFVTDRPGHDHRYAIDASYIEKSLGWTPSETFETGIEKTIKWYLEESSGWCKRVQDGTYQRERIGIS